MIFTSFAPPLSPVALPESAVGSPMFGIILEWDLVHVELANDGLDCFTRL
jgi:hypothetical protein